mmetsp:Transcript_41500/g.95387  ORF Transcript_41500/g.95387 Transcript_41500/m.95387 type:complete len:150 (-) Transcript_41500:38-487(-)
MPPGRSARGRGRGEGGGGGRQQASAAPAGGKPAADAGVRKGAGRGIPDYKAGSQGDAEGGDSSAGPAPKFNHQEAAEWMQTRYQSVVDEYEKQKASGKKGDIQNFADLNQERSAWSNAKPVIPPKDDFLAQLQQALVPFMRKPDEKGSA